MTSPSQTPVRYPSGVSTDQVFGPLANYGLPNPFFWHTVMDDFDGTPAGDEIFSQQTATGTSAAIAQTAGDGGLWTLTTGTASNNATTLATTVADFALPPATYAGTGLTTPIYTGKKLIFLARIVATNVAQTSFIVGLTNHQTTPTVAGITDGVYIQITSATVANLIAVSGSTVQFTVPIPAAVLALYYANLQWIDVGFEIDRSLNVYALFGFPLVGWQPPSAWTGVNNVNAQPTPKARVAAQQNFYNGTLIATPWTPTAVNLSPTIMAYSTGAASNTALVDFAIAAKER
jgi:hypothetical protein